MNAFVITSSTAQGFKTQLLEQIASKGKPNLCLAYVDSQSEFHEIPELTRSLDIQLLGVTTCGEVYNEKIMTKSITAIFLNIAEADFAIYIAPFESSILNTALMFGEFAAASFTNPGIITYVSGIGTDGDAVVKGIKEKTFREVPIFGGLAGDDFRNEKHTVFTNSSFEENGLVGVVFDTDKIEMLGKTYSGWKDLGRTHTVTKAYENILYEVDGIPALDLFKEYFGELSYTSNSEENRIIEAPGMCPLKIMTDDGVEYLRAPLLYNYKNKSLILGGRIEEGGEFKFCPPPSFDTVQDTIEVFKSYAADNQEVDCVVVTGCAGRKQAFGPLCNDEIKHLYGCWKVPTAGYLAMGEIGATSMNKECNYHNVSLSIVTLKEK